MAPPSRAAASVRRYVAAVAAGAAGVLAVLAAQGGVTWPALAFGLLYGVALFFVERTSIVLPWGRQRITMTLAEAPVFIGLLYLPGVVVSGVAVVSRVAVGAFARRPPIKIAFNAALVGLSTGVAALAYGGLLALGAPSVLAAAAGLVAFSSLNEVLLAGVLARAEGTPVLVAYRERLLGPNLVGVGYGLAAGLCALALLRLHPAAVVALAPFLWLLSRHGEREARAERENELHQRLAAESQRLIGCETEDVIAQRILSICVECFVVRAARLELESGRSWAEGEPGFAPAEPPSVSCAVEGREGRRLGTLSVWSKPGRRIDPAHDRILLRVVASQAATSLESLEVLREVQRRDAARREEKIAALNTLVAGVAHEINNPLMYVQGHLELAAMDIEDPRAPAEDAPKQIQIALQGLDRIRAIVKALRVMSRAPAPAERSRVAMDDVVLGACEFMRVAVPGSVRLEHRLSDGRAEVLGSAGDLHQVVLNLVKNAVEATAPSGGRVRVDVRAEDDAVVLTVSDDGPGMDEETQRSLFTPFFTTKGTQGTGLGLSVVHGIVREHGGTIDVESKPGLGARFRVALPRAPPAGRTPSAA